MMNSIKIDRQAMERVQENQADEPIDQVKFNLLFLFSKYYR